MPKSFVLSYDIHTPDERDIEEKRLETEKRYRMRVFLDNQNADEVCKSTYVVHGFNGTVLELYNQIMTEIIKDERSGDCVYVAEIKVPAQHTREYRKNKAGFERMQELAGIKK